MPTSSEGNDSLKITKRLRVNMPGPIVNEVKARVYSDLEGTSFDWVNFNIEKVDVGIIGDIV